MSGQRKKPAGYDLFGSRLTPRLPLRKAVERPDGRGWDIARREPDSTVYRHLGLSYGTKGEAWQALRSGIGKEPGPVSVTVNVTVLHLGRKRR